ncbi:hypothetical protein [Burkholderia sp. WSM2232]|uniref:hypothetical protein n=1 Tax=Burkholderia sp. WSM2232 TaxID=944436 RepID=UPI0003F7BD14|nr:hypothetical protein [Burkholderia sp. WSM2232]
MEYRQLGRSGIKASTLTLGAMMSGGPTTGHLSTPGFDDPEHPFFRRLVRSTPPRHDETLPQQR